MFVGIIGLSSFRVRLIVGIKRNTFVTVEIVLG